MVSLFLITAVGAAVSIRPARWDWVLWPESVAVIRDAMVVVGPLMSVCAAVLAAANSRQSVVAGPSSGRPALQRVLRPVLILTLTSVTAYAAGAVPVIWAAARSDGILPDTSSALSLLATLVSLCIWPALGYLCGAVLPGVRGVVLSVVAGGVLLALPIELSTTRDVSQPGTSYMSVAPFWGLAFPRLGWATDPALSVARITLFVLTAAGLILMCVAVLDRRAGRSVVAWAPVAAAMAMVAVVGGTLIVRAPELVTPDPHRRVQCVQLSSGWTWCSDARTADRTPEVERIAAEVARLTPPPMGVAVVAWGAHPADAAGTDATAIDEAGPSLTEPDEYVRTELARYFAMRSTGGWACDEKLSQLDGPRLPEALGESVALQQEIEQTIVARVVGEVDDTRFASVSDREFSEWMNARRDAVQDCSLTPS